MIKMAVTLLLCLSSVIFSQQKESYYFVFLNTNPDREELSDEKVDSLQKGHMDNIKMLAEQDKLIAAGPFYGGGGIFILNADSRERVDEYLSTDPAIQANRFNLEIFPVEIVKGKLCKAPEEFNMVTYTFIRHTSENNNLITEDESLLLQIKFPGTEEGISIINYNLEEGDSETLKKILNPEIPISYIKAIWIAEESFCN